jgi:hypothetical protein
MAQERVVDASQGVPCGWLDRFDRIFKFSLHEK